MLNKQLRRKINGDLYYCEAIRETKEGAIHSRDARKAAQQTNSIMVNIIFSFTIYWVGITGHACKWSLCPYKGIEAAQYERAVSEYVGEACTDAYHIDMLHLQYPNDEYEQLEDRLIKSQTNVHKTR